MKRKYSLSVIILIIIMILPAGCKREEFIWGKKIGNLTYSEDIVLLGAEEDALLSGVTDNGMVFSGSTAEIEKITNNSLLIMGVTEKTPFGLLRKVTGVQKNGTEVVITSSDALLTDILKEGTITLQMKLLEKDFKLKSKMDGVLVTGPGKSFDGLAVTLDNFEIFRDGTKVARLNGSIGISPEIDLTIKVGANEINEIKAVITLNKIDELTVTSNGAFSGGHEFVAAEFVHSPIIIDSLVFVPVVKIICGFNGTVSSEVTSGVRQDRVITSKLNYTNSNWSEDPLAYSETHDFTVPQITDNSSLKIFSGPEITVNLFGIPVQTIKATGFYSLEAQKTASPFWRLLIGNDGQNSVKSDVLGLGADYTSNIIIQASEIANANGRK
jgi:hypothetical protein